MSLGVKRIHLLSALVFLGGLVPGAGASVLRDVRFWTVGDVTRVALETTEEVEYRQDRIGNPDRIFVDLFDVQPLKSFRGLAYTVPVGDGRVRQIRVAVNQAGVTRVVLDLDAPVTVSTTRLTKPDRIVLELRARAAGAVSGGPAPPAAPPSVESDPPPRPRLAAKPFVPPPVPLRKPSAPLAVNPASLPRVTLTAAARPLPVFASPVLRVSPPPRPASDAASAAARPDPVRSGLLRREEDTRIPRAAQQNRGGNRSLTRVLGLKLGRVVLDPGHGGADEGTHAPGGLVEKELVLDVALRLGKLLEERLGTEVIYTRTDDTFVPLEVRTEIANRKNADLFLSIHANSSPVRSVAGVETYYLNFTGSRVDMEVAARENAGSERTIGELSDLLRKIARQDKQDESREFAARIQAAAYELSAQTNGRIRNRGVKAAPFVVLIGAEMPSVLTEIGFLTNPREEANMKKPEHRQRMAEALYKGVYQYAQSLSHFRVARTAED